MLCSRIQYQKFVSHVLCKPCLRGARRLSKNSARVEERASIPTALSRSAPRLLVLGFFPNSKRVLLSYLSCRSPPGRRGSPGRCPHSTRNSGCRSRWPCGAPVVVSRVCRPFPRVRWPFVSTSSYRNVTAMFVGRTLVMAVTFWWPFRRSLPL